MKQIISRLPLLFFLIISLACGRNNNPPAPENILVIPQQQDPYANGVIHGKLLQKEIQVQLSDWETAMRSNLTIERDSLLAIVFEHSGFYKQIENEAQELLDELKGIAEGAEVDWKMLLCFNLGEEIFNFATANFERCSNIGYVDEEIKVLAYNQDLPEFLHGSGKIIVLRHSDHLVFTLPGLLALSGISKQLAVSCNSLPMLQMDDQGLGLSFLLRQLLQETSFAAVEQRINEVALAVPQNLMLLHAEGISNVELSKNQTHWISTAKDELLYHTNFPIKNTDFKATDYKQTECKRYQYFSDIAMSTTTDPLQKLEESCASSPILNQETFLRFIASIDAETAQMKVKLIHPTSQESIEFNL